MKPLHPILIYHLYQKSILLSFITCTPHKYTIFTQFQQSYYGLKIKY
ncbi:hypothetical protein HMPREF9441_01620 [Paraprevotella clara YIT 11840]|uniref:Uncharacterized protein n=1 Tax=Paraprevotella clara YIT 11840 TaxID=762968 RepID=G5SQI1_9BACT|nr:hypothetical protein HMPREF9441_01620 [Paraprevotella clara YIT 11840]